MSKSRVTNMEFPAKRIRQDLVAEPGFARIYWRAAIPAWISRSTR